MFRRLVQKEILNHLLDLRFAFVMALCVALCALSVYAGCRNYARQVREYDSVSTENRRNFQENSIDRGRLFDLVWVGYKWNRRPAVLSPVVYGLSGSLGQEVLVRYQRAPVFEASLFETDPFHALFEVLDLAFVINVVLSLCVILFTYDAVCGEKEAGTLRLGASFPVPRSTLALAKLVGSTVAVLAPFAVSFLIAAAVLAASSDVDMRGDEWGRLGALLGVFSLYLACFAAFGLWISALTHRRAVAFLGLLLLWTAWIFLLPSLSVDLARRIEPSKSTYEIHKRDTSLRWAHKMGAREERQAYWQAHPVENWEALTEDQRQGIRDAMHEIETRGLAKYHSSLSGMQRERRNQMRRQQRLVAALSAISPYGAVRFATINLARTGPVQHELVGDALNAYLVEMDRYIQDKERHVENTLRDVDMSDFTLFSYTDSESLSACLSRNAFNVLNLVLLALLGFAGAYVAVLRYDVR